jgi:hypothetical protein
MHFVTNDEQVPPVLESILKLLRCIGCVCRKCHTLDVALGKFARVRRKEVTPVAQVGSRSTQERSCVWHLLCKLSPPLVVELSSRHKNQGGLAAFCPFSYGGYSGERLASTRGEGHDAAMIVIAPTIEGSKLVGHEGSR